MPPPTSSAHGPKPRRSNRKSAGKSNLPVDILTIDFAGHKGLKENMSTKTGLVFDERMVEYRCLFDDDYPECPNRFAFSLQRCRDYGLEKRCTVLPSRPATQDELQLQHSSALIDVVKSTKDCEDRDRLFELSSKYDSTYFHPKSYEMSLLAAGCTIDLMTSIVENKLKNGMAIVRPPGHHAMHNDACGYCYFNNVAIAAKHALDNLDVKRILIVDWDVHHGQATQYSFYDDPRVLYFSIHRYEHGSFWPELRQSNYDYIGEGAGRGYNFNLPLNKTGLGNAEYLAIFHQVLLPVAHEFSPDLVIISAGYDAAIGCREGEMEVTPACYAHLTSQLMSLANGKVCVVLEGGYCIKSLSEGVALTLRTLLGDPCPRIGATGAVDDSAVETIANVISVQRPFWKCLRFQGDFEDKDVPKGKFLLAKNEWPCHSPVLKYVGKPPPEVYPVIGFYPVQSPEVVADLDRRIDHLIATTDLTVPLRKTCLVFDRRMTLHKNTQESHPEKPERLTAILLGLQEFGLLERCKVLESRLATEQELLLFHCQEHINLMKDVPEMKTRDINRLSDRYRSIYLCRETYQSALLAAGCLLQVIDEVVAGNIQNGAAAVRPPGHHAESDEACGFCVFNNVVIAAKYALDKFSLKRILIVDWDVHHGNGVQNAFENDPRVLYISIHRYNHGGFFPGGPEANFDYIGKEQGVGFNVNVPWNTTSLGDGDYLAVFHQLLLPLAYQFDPELVLVSAGFDAAKGDFLGNCCITPEGYAHMTQLLMGLANGKLVLALEGGYNLEALSTSFAACVKVLLGDPCPSLPAGLHPCESAIRSISDVISHQKPHWSSLKFQVNLPFCESTVARSGVDSAVPEHLDLMMLKLTVTEENADDTADGAYAVVPKTDCPHLEAAIPLAFYVMDVVSPCSVCDEKSENWMCLTCHKIYCGRYKNSHMLLHNTSNSEHAIAFSLEDFSVWCYRCDSYIENEEVLGPYLDAANIAKFGNL